jgi:hypothetical protein
MLGRLVLILNRRVFDLLDLIEVSDDISKLGTSM